MENKQIKLDLKNLSSFFKDIKKQISKRCIIIEFGDQNIKLCEAKLIKQDISFRAFRNIKLPNEALNKGVPSEPLKMSKVLMDLMDEENINTNSAAVVLSSESIFIKNVLVPIDLSKSEAIKYLINSSSPQLPIPISQLDFDLIESSGKESFDSKKEFMLIAIPKKLTDVIAETLDLAGLDLKLIDFNCISNTRLLYKEQGRLNNQNLILLLDFKNDATFFTLLDKNGPILIERISSLREYPHNFSDNTKSKNEYLEISKLDLKIIVKDIKRILNIYFENSTDQKNYEIFMIGPNSAHPKLVDTLGELLNKNVYLVSPTNCEGIYDVKYNQDINEFFIGSLIGTGLGLNKIISIDSKKSQDFKYIKKFIVDKSNNKLLKNIKEKSNTFNKPLPIKKENNSLEKKIEKLNTNFIQESTSNFKESSSKKEDKNNKNQIKGSSSKKEDKNNKNQIKGSSSKKDDKNNKNQIKGSSSKKDDKDNVNQVKENSLKENKFKFDKKFLE